MAAARCVISTEPPKGKEFLRYGEFMEKDFIRSSSDSRRSDADYGISAGFFRRWGDMARLGIDCRSTINFMWIVFYTYHSLPSCNY